MMQTLAFLFFVSVAMFALGVTVTMLRQYQDKIFLALAGQSFPIEYADNVVRMRRTKPIQKGAITPVALPLPMPVAA